MSLMTALPFQNEMLEEGHDYAVMLYTWRSCSRAIPQVRPSLPFREASLLLQCSSNLNPNQRAEVPRWREANLGL
jgi:hypothetical protein